MPDLILLNGPPASGKSTLAAGLIATRPLALNLDVDAVRAMLGAWLEDPHESGVAARRLAVAMIDTHLAHGYDVVVPQFIARPGFAEELEAAAARAGARFVEIALVVSHDETLQAFASRSTAPENQLHKDAHRLLERSGGIEALGEMYVRYTEFLDTRPNARRVEVVRGDVESTLRLVEAVVATSP